MSPPEPKRLDQTQDWIAPSDAVNQTQEYIPNGVAPATPPKAPTKVLVSTLGDFRLIGKLGEGGMGTVFKAIQISRNRIVALKVMSKELGANASFVERFHREVRIMGKLDHTNIVRLIAAGEAHGFIFLAMELLEGGTVGTWLGKLGRFAVADAVLIAKSCGMALQYAHESGLIHRDVKPDNLLISKAGIVKLADLGLAKTTDDADVGLTRTGIGIGTPLYAAPEQVRDAKHADPRCDLYALGCLLYHCLTGITPFPATDMLTLIKAKEKGTYVTASIVNKRIPPALDRILSRLLAKLPDHRYPSAVEFLQELEFTALAGEELSFLATAT